MNTVPRLTTANFLHRWRRRQASRREKFFAFYSSIFGGITTERALMLLPVDDHVVHRGDGVFETCKTHAGAVYALAPHLIRLRGSAARIGLEMPWSDDALTDILAQTLAAAGRPEALARIIVSRGIGGMGVSPYECSAPELYIMIYALPPPFMEIHPGGARAVRSRQPLKPGFLANIKTCNYLPNALLKKEALDRGADFAVALDEKDELAEGATENFAVVTRDGRLRFPPPDRILVGITQARVAELAGALVASGALRAVETVPIPSAALDEAAELLLLGTTTDVTAVTELDGRPVGDGRPGPVQRELYSRLRRDLLENTAWRTPYPLPDPSAD